MLSDMKVLDFTSLLPGPFATMMLGDLGAEIIKVESPYRVDLLQEEEPKIENISVIYRMVNRNKKIIKLDLKKEESIKKIYQLISEFDVIIEGFRPGVMTRLGLDYDSLNKINDKIIYCSLTGYGQYGSMSNRAGHDINYLALSGLLSFSGKNDEVPHLNGIQIADLAGGSLHSVIGILSAYIHRQKTGLGQHIDVSMLDTTFSLSIFNVSKYLVNSILPTRGDNILNGGSLYDYYKTKDNRYLSIGSLEPKFQIQLYEGLQIESQPDELFDQDLKAIISNRIAEKSLEDWIKIFQNLDACVEPVLNLDEVLKQQHFIDRNLIIPLVSSNDQKIQQINHPVKYSKYKVEPKSLRFNQAED
ncbi:MAG: Formyl-coenzyme A transferase [Candidatus Heimdallarchaeota archaeon LC_2]|nr:MAG: Formyl-coenzyme A transferase [Candidatus Heimdallarchaeota archaeon LC_2]